MNKLPLFHIGASGGIHFEKDQIPTHNIALFVFLLGIIIIFVILTLRLFELTIVKGGYYRQLSEQNRIKELFIEPQRGEIQDRKGFVVVKNISANIEKNDERIQSLRVYESGEAIAPLIGYRQTADKNDFKNDRCIYKLKLGDKIGKKGIEKLYDCQLRGTYGKKLIEVDAKGKYLKTLTILQPRKGDMLKLSFDFELQKKVYDLIKNKRAAAVGVNPKTGEILFFVSSPSFDPQSFEDQRSDEITKLFNNKEKPLFNRVTEGAYPPGSIFKLVIATGSLEEKSIDEKTLFEDTGTITAGPLKFGNWYFLQYGKTEGMVNIVKAIQRSNDIFFYKAGEALGPEKIKKWADIFGYGKNTGIGFDEAEGTIPSPFWKQETLHDQWYLGDTYNISIGQGYVNVTPLQTVMTASVFANNGYLCQPQLIKFQNSNIKSQNCKKLPISQKTINIIREGMKEACSTGGTGWPLFDFKVTEKLNTENKSSSDSSKMSYKPIQVGCKTGTAESHATSGIPHAWILAFAPFDNPEIAISILIEESGQGSDIAGPIAKEIFKAYFERFY